MQIINTHITSCPYVRPVICRPVYRPAQPKVNGSEPTIVAQQTSVSESGTGRKKRPRNESDSSSEDDHLSSFVNFTGTDARPETRKEKQEREEREREESIMHTCIYNHVYNDYNVATGSKKNCCLCKFERALKNVTVDLSNHQIDNMSKRITKIDIRTRELNVKGRLY